MLTDEHGDELPDIESAYLHAFDCASELWTELLARREDPTGCSIEVSNQEGQFLFVVPLKEVLETARKKLISKSEPTKVASILMEKNQALCDSLLAQIESIRRTLDRTQDLLRALRKLDVAH